MSTPDDLKKLRILLSHWVEHNSEHAEEFAKWAERARAAGANDAALHLADASGRLQEANKSLREALESLGGESGDMGA